MADPFSKSKPRLVFVDVLRLIAALQMIQGHSVDAVLAPSYRVGEIFRAWTFLRGLTSTIFLVTAGLSFVLAAQAASDPQLARAVRTRRALKLIALGYLMHFPFADAFGAELRTALSRALVVDVLQCIGLSLLLLESLQGVQNRLLRGSLALLAGLACFALVPWVHTWRADDVPLLFTNWLSAGHGSPFPCLPWAGFTLCGFAAGTFALPIPGQSLVGTRRKLGLSALVALVLSALAAPLCAGLPQPLSPSFFLLKLGLVLALATGLALLFRPGVRLPDNLTRLSQETLFLYVSHAFVLYADRVGIVVRWGKRGTPVQGIVLALLMLATCSAGALAYRGLMRALRQREGGGTPAPERAKTPLPPG